MKLAWHPCSSNYESKFSCFCLKRREGKIHNQQHPCASRMFLELLLRIVQAIRKHICEGIMMSHYLGSQIWQSDDNRKPNQSEGNNVPAFTLNGWTLHGWKSEMGWKSPLKNNGGRRDGEMGRRDGEIGLKISSKNHGGRRDFMGFVFVFGKSVPSILVLTYYYYD